MKIDLNSSTPDPVVTPRQNNNDVTSTSQIHNVEQVSNAAEDKTTLSFDGASVDALASQAMSSTDVRQDRVDALRQAVSNGQYKVDPDQVAEAMLQESPKL
jgi:negative regulator of flagellin synthesis FlgM